MRSFYDENNQWLKYAFNSLVLSPPRCQHHNKMSPNLWITCQNIRLPTKMIYNWNSDIQTDVYNCAKYFCSLQEILEVSKQTCLELKKYFCVLYKMQQQNIEVSKQADLHKSKVILCLFYKTYQQNTEVYTQANLHESKVFLCSVKNIPAKHIGKQTGKCLQLSSPLPLNTNVPAVYLETSGKKAR